MPVIVHKFTAPSYWASYLINGDASGLVPPDIARCDTWIERLGYGVPVDCADAGFRVHHDAWLESPLGGDCQTYTFLECKADCDLTAEDDERLWRDSDGYPVEVPDDTPCLDDSFHRHEMDID